MTNLNVVASKTQGGIDITIKVALSSPTIFQSTSSKSVSPAAPMRYVAIKKLKTLETVGNLEEEEPVIKSWLRSMRDASPTRSHKSPTITRLMSHQTEDRKPPMVDRPSALRGFEQVVRDSKGKQIAVFLDYDGTLSPIVEDPDQAFMSNEMREAVRDVARYFPTAIVTGRCRDKVYNFVKLAELYYAGSHGMDIEGPTKSCKYKNSNQHAVFQPARDFLPMIEEVYKALMEMTKTIPGAHVENNKFCVSVHFRRVDESMWTTLAKQVLSVLRNYPKLRLSPGRKVLEIRPTIKWDKGKALEFLLESLGIANSKNVLPVYIGDDRTDEDAFKVLRDRGHGIGILVSNFPKETKASYSLQDPSEVKEFLRRLVEWKRMSVGGHHRV